MMPAMPNPRVAFLATVAAAGLAAAAPARAQGPGTPPPPPPRIGWEVGLGLYGGEINCENENGDFCDGVTEAGGFDLHAAYFFRPNLGIYVDVWPMFHSEDNWTFTHNIVSVGAKWRPAPILTLTGGIGSAQARLRYEAFGLQGETETDVVGAVMFAAAIDVVRGRSFAIDLEARAGIGFYDDDDNGNGEADVVGRNLGVGAAITWF